MIHRFELDHLQERLNASIVDLEKFCNAEESRLIQARIKGLIGSLAEASARLETFIDETFKAEEVKSNVIKLSDHR